MPTDHATRAVIYLRQSLDAKGDGLAVERQRADCRRIAEQRGWTVAAEYVDNSISASDKRKARPGYDELVLAYERGEFEALVCWDLDRLTRQPRQLEDWIDAAEGRGLRLVTANGEADLTTDGGRMYARIKAAVARAEVERKGARQRAAAAQRADNGRPPLGPRLTGYTSTGALVPGEAAIVAELFRRFVAGDSLRSLAAWLTTSGVPPRRGGARWNPSSVVSILHNPRYAGRAVYNGRETGKAGAWQPIVSDDVFAIAAARLADPRRRSQNGTDRKHLGSSLYRCGPCGRPVVAWSGVRYRCPDGCVTRSRRQVDAFVLAVVRERLARPDLGDVLPRADTGQARALNDEIRAVRERLARIDQEYDAGLIDGRRYRSASDRARGELLAAESALARLAPGVSADAAGVLSAADPVAAFDAAPLMLQRGTIDALITVRLHPSPVGSRTFRPETVNITWRET
ncbi:recombinase family protein [Pseudonocardia sichuanensis]